MPEISAFEDKLKQNNDHNEKIDVMMRRLDEVVCQKSDRQALKEFRDFCDITYMSKSDSDATKELVADRITSFGSRVDEMESMVKFQARQLQKEMFSAVRRAFNQH